MMLRASPSARRVRMEIAVTDLVERIFALSPHVRYVAVSRDSELTLRQTANLQDASAPESDRYEELLVNPTLLTLVGQRGRIDCGGLDYVIIRYGHFFQVVRPTENGHVSVAVEPHGDPIGVATALERLLASDAA